jgi:uncharacterized protein (TIGR02594 family)
MQEHGTLTSSSVWQTHIVGKGRAKFYANRSAQALAVGRKLMPKWSTGLTFVGGRGTVLEAPKNTYNETPWITIAQSQLGVAEIKGDKANPTILNYFKATSYHSKDDSGATGSWCSAFANWSVEQVGISGTNSPAAKSWIGWGDKLTSYKYGAVVIVNQIGTSSYHVGFAVGQTDTYTTILGGNQGSIGAVTESNFYNSSYNFYYYYPSN